jgi:hypothetical protein
VSNKPDDCHSEYSEISPTSARRLRFFATLNMIARGF